MAEVVGCCALLSVESSLQLAIVVVVLQLSWGFGVFVVVAIVGSVVDIGCVGQMAQPLRLLWSLGSAVAVVVVWFCQPLPLRL